MVDTPADLDGNDRGHLLQVLAALDSARVHLYRVLRGGVENVGAVVCLSVFAGTQFKLFPLPFFFPSFFFSAVLTFSLRAVTKSAWLEA